MSERIYDWKWNQALASKPTEIAPNIEYKNLDDFLQKNFKTSQAKLKQLGIILDRKMVLEMDVEPQLYKFDDSYMGTLDDFLHEYGTSIEEMKSYGFELEEYTRDSDIER